MPQINPNSDAGLWLRGMLLFAAMAAIAGIVLFVALWRPSFEAPADALPPEHLTLLLVTPQAPFPGAVSWGALYRFDEISPRLKGWETRYNATIALARRGSDRVRLAVLREMLDEKRQRVNFRVRQKEGGYVQDERAVMDTVRNALGAFVEWHEHPEAVKKFGRNNADLVGVYEAVDRLAQSSNPVIRVEAEKARKKLGRM